MRQTAVISGASSGIGAATAKKFSDEGFDLILLGRNEDRLNATKQSCATDSHIECLSFDLTKIQEFKQSLVSRLNSSKSPLAVLINNAGVYKVGGFMNHTSLDWENQFQTNLLGPVLLTQILWPFFVKQKSGSIVNVSSTLGIKPTANSGAYSAIKAGLNNWTMSLAQEGGPFNIRANCICPGIVDTPIHGFEKLNSQEAEMARKTYSQLQLLSRMGKPEEIAETIFFIASEKSAWTTGSIFSVDGGISII